MSAPPSERRFKLLVVGVGGQGVLTAGRWLGEAALLERRPVVVGQLHGMSQRGGSVEATVLVGPGHGSFLEDGSADVVVAFEPVELLRARPKTSSRTRVVANRGRVALHVLARQGEPYPDVDRILTEAGEACGDLVQVEGSDLAERAGDARHLNVVMLGALAGTGALPFPADAVWRAVEAATPHWLAESSRRAFALGQEAVVS